MTEKEKKLGPEGGRVRGEPWAVVGVGMGRRRVDPEDGGLGRELFRVGFPFQLVVLRVHNEGERVVERSEPRGGGPRGYAGGEGGGHQLALEW